MNACPTWCANKGRDACAQGHCFTCSLCLQPPNSPSPHLPLYSSACAARASTVRVGSDGLLYLGSARFFASGLVLSGMTLMDYVTNADRDRIETALLRSRHIGATSLRWNALLKGQELEWASGGSLYGLRPGCTRAVREVADMALAHGIKLQIVLGTAHFLRFGYGGPDNVLNGISNRERVRNIHSMMTNESGIAAFLERVIDPIAASLGGAVHPAVLGFLIVNEGYAMVRKDDKVFFDETDATLTLRELQRWVNRIAGRLHAKLPGTLLSASLKLRKHEPSMEREGKLNTAQWFEDAELIGAGGDPLGTLQLHQYQYYPETAYGPEASPFVNTASTLRAIHRASLKPMLAGEFPVEGLHVVPGHNPIAFTLEASYEALWTGGYSGGFAWNSDLEASAGDGRVAIEEAYRRLAAHLLTTASASAAAVVDAPCDDVHGAAAAVVPAAALINVRAHRSPPWSPGAPASPSPIPLWSPGAPASPSPLPSPTGPAALLGIPPARPALAHASRGEAAARAKDEPRRDGDELVASPAAPSPPVTAHPAPPALRPPHNPPVSIDAAFGDDHQVLLLGGSVILLASAALGWLLWRLYWRHRAIPEATNVNETPSTSMKKLCSAPPRTSKPTREQKTRGGRSGGPKYLPVAL